MQDKINELFLGKYVVIRTHETGVFCGFLEEYDKESRTAIVRESRRLWRWHTRFTLSEAAEFGLFEEGSKISVPVSLSLIVTIKEIHIASEIAREKIMNLPIFVASKG